MIKFAPRKIEYILKHLVMKAGIHPENYRVVAFKDMSNEDVFLTKSTAETNETIDVDGVNTHWLSWRFPEHPIPITLVNLNW